jgi:lipopolysaccharide export LptBFGC system permease protein LptF
MIKILTRHALFSLLPNFIFAVVALMFLWLTYDLFDTLPDFLKQKPTLEMLFAFYGAQLPKVALIVVPVALLFTSFQLTNQWSKNRELAIIQASGVSPFVMCAPFLVVAFLSTGLLIYFNFEKAPQAEIERRVIQERIAHKKNYTFTYNGVVYRNPENGNVWYLSLIHI